MVMFEHDFKTVRKGYLKKNTEVTIQCVCILQTIVLLNINMIISVTKLIALSGHNPYYQAIDAFYGLRRRNSYNFKIRQVLLKHPIAERFINVAKITPKLKQDARIAVNKLCKKH